MLGTWKGLPVVSCLCLIKTDSVQEVTVSISEGCYWVICAWIENLGFATQLDTVKYKSSCDMQLPGVTAAWVWTSYHNYHHLSSSIIIHHKNHCHMELCMCCKSSWRQRDHVFISDILQLGLLHLTLSCTFLKLFADSLQNIL